MINVEEVKTKIISIIEQRGPSLPVHIAKKIELSPVFASAILSELTNAKRLKLSNLKVGSSPLYLLPGQEQQLENFLDNIEGVKKTALLKLKENKILDDEKQVPAIRVALRSIRDFAIPLKFQNKLFWKYFTVDNNEAQSLIDNPQITKTISQQQKPTTIHKTNEHAVGGPKRASPRATRVGPFSSINSKPTQTRKKPSQFLEDLKQFLLSKDIELLKQISTDKKEIICITRINSDLGKISFLTVAKDKKRLTEADLTVAYQKAQHEKMPCLFLSYGEPSKKMLTWTADYKNIIRVMKIE